MSPRAACRLESLGCTNVYDYVAGRADWFAYGLPMEGRLAPNPRVGEFASRDVPRCRLTEVVGDVRRRVREAGWNECVVVSDDSIVLGLLHGAQLESNPDFSVEQVMRSGPATFRPDVSVSSVVERMRKRGVHGVLVTTPDGRLVGLLRREDAERAETHSQDSSPAA